MLTLAVTTSTSAAKAEGQRLAEKLHLPFSETLTEYDYFLQLTPDCLQLIKPGSKLSGVFVDFLSGKMNYRRLHASFRNESIIRALGLKKHTQPIILDATAGLGQDSFVLACLGFEVTLLERSPIVHALLEDGIKRATHQPELRLIMDKLHLIQADAITWLKNATSLPDIIYLDPMFPDRKKTAAVKKEMQIFQDILLEPANESVLLETALACATKRVVVKRPRLADPIPGISPSFNLVGSSSRFDIYLITH
jgi:16S rRNA (guanine1516-N2)-methyltransferase